MSGMSEIHAEASAATRCATIGCDARPTEAMVWTPVIPDDDAPEVDAVCTECAESYRRRPWLAARVTFLPFGDES